MKRKSNSKPLNTGKIDLNYSIAKCYLNVYNEYKGTTYTSFAFSGGRGGGKSTFAHHIAITESFDVDNGGCTLYVRRYAASLRDTVYADVKTCIDKLNLTEYFDFSLSPLLIVNKITNYAIQFKGLDDEQKTKGMKPVTKRFKLLVVEECQEFNTQNLVAELKATVVRGDSEACKIFYLFNPHPNPEHWVNKELKQTSKHKQHYHIHTTFKDMPIKWLGKTFISDAVQLMKSNIKMFRYRYLGEAIASEDAIFENVLLKDITDEQINQWFRNDINIYQGLDFGYYPDPNAANIMHYDLDNRILYIFGEWQAHKLNNQQINQQLRQSALKINYRIEADHDQKDIDELNSMGWTIYKAIKNEKNCGRDDHFEWLQKLNMIVIDEKRCPNTALEFTNYHYKINRDGSVASIYPEGQDDHHIAAVRYALGSQIKKVGV